MITRATTYLAFTRVPYKLLRWRSFVSSSREEIRISVLRSNLHMLIDRTILQYNPLTPALAEACDECNCNRSGSVGLRYCLVGPVAITVMGRRPFRKRFDSWS